MNPNLWRAQRRQALALRHVHFQHRDGDGDREHAVAESFKPPLPMPTTPSSFRDVYFAIGARFCGYYCFDHALNIGDHHMPRWIAQNHNRNGELR